jgi:DNA-binding PadR family transcriptional regulator
MGIGANMPRQMFAPKDLVVYLQVLPKLSDTNINHVQNAYLCENPDSLAYPIKKLQFPRRIGLHRKRKRTIKRKRDLTKYVDARSIGRYINALERKGFIERFEIRGIERDSKPYRLTSSGVYYLILRKTIMPYNILKGIFKNYQKDKLFQLFLYPNIKKDTLREISDVLLVSRISLFLYQCCREVEEILVDSGKKQQVMELMQDRQSEL